jgi:hypothetical protein
MLTLLDGKHGRNFLNHEIYDALQERLDLQPGTFDTFRPLCDMLSPEAACINLLGPLFKRPKLATRLFAALFPGQVQQVRKTWLAYSPQPSRDYLNDRSLLDGFIEYERPNGQLAFFGISLRLSDGFNQPISLTPQARSWLDRLTATWQEPVIERFIQSPCQALWRDHLLVLALRKRYATGSLLVLSPQDNLVCPADVQAYRSLLNDPDGVLALSLEQVIAAWETQPLEPRMEYWLPGFRQRYLDLSASQVDYEAYCAQRTHPAD